MIKVPEKIQLGYKLSENEKEMKLDPSRHPLAYARRWGTTAAEKKLTESMKSWCLGWNRDYINEKEFEPIILKNEPIIGFKFGKSISRWSTSNKVFEVFDPRGFKLQIPAANLAILIGSAHIEKGEIKSPCVWGFEGGNVILLDVESEYYITEKNKTENEEKRVSDLIKVKKKDLITGNVYQKKNKRKSIYLGQLNFEAKCSDGYYRYNNNNYRKPESFEKIHVFAELIKYENWEWNENRTEKIPYEGGKYSIYLNFKKGYSGYFLCDEKADIDIDFLKNNCLKFSTETNKGYLEKINLSEKENWTCNFYIHADSIKNKGGLKVDERTIKNLKFI